MIKIVYSIFVIIISLAFAFLTYILNKKFADRQIEVQSLKQYPPEGFDPATVAVLYNDVVTDEQINALIIHLANKGYLRIEETSLRDFNTNFKNYRISEVKKYDGNDEKERLFLKEMLQYGLNDVSIASTELFGNIGTTTSEIRKSISSEYRSKLYKSFMSGLAKWAVIMIVLILICIFIVPAIVPERIMSIFAGIIGIGAILAIGYFGKDLKARTAYGNQILEEIEGFKKFSETANRDDLINLLNQNPNYFYEMLSYTFAIGSSDSWFKRFNDIELSKPEWYVAQNEFKINDIKEFVEMLKKMK